MRHFIRVLDENSIVICDQVEEQMKVPDVEETRLGFGDFEHRSFAIVRGGLRTCRASRRQVDVTSEAAVDQRHGDVKATW